MSAYRKKPVIVEAVRVRDVLGPLCSTDPRGAPEWVRAAYYGDDGAIAWASPRALGIRTLEGEMTALADDWLIRGVKGELYPCKPDIFEATYEPASAPPSTGEGRSPSIRDACPHCHQPWPGHEVSGGRGEVIRCPPRVCETCADGRIMEQVDCPECNGRLPDVDDGISGSIASSRRTVSAVAADPSPPRTPTESQPEGRAPKVGDAVEVYTEGKWRPAVVDAVYPDAFSWDVVPASIEPGSLYGRITGATGFTSSAWRWPSRTPEEPTR